VMALAGDTELVEHLNSISVITIFITLGLIKGIV
jgi:hypothetical protein